MAVAHAELMSVGPDEVVVTFTTEPGAEVRTRVGDAEVVTTGPLHTARVTGLAADTEYPLAVEGTPADRWLPARVRTLVQPAGRLLATLATANDVHFGETECGRTGDPATDAIGPILRSAPGARPYPEVMNGAVVDEMLALDPDAVVVKGDLTDSGRESSTTRSSPVTGGSARGCTTSAGTTTPSATRSWRDAGRAVRGRGSTEWCSRCSTPRCRGTSVARCRSRSAAWLDELAAGTPDPVLVFAHHPSFNPDPNYGLSPGDHEALLALIARRENIAGYLSGHTHSNHVVRDPRAREVPCVEVACAKDYPGAWAEYRVYEGGYTQVMRRVAAPAAREWSELGRTMIQGIYRDLVLGTIDDRCFTQLF